jgi:hypothetical protein
VCALRWHMICRTEGHAVFDTRRVGLGRNRPANGRCVPRLCRRAGHLDVARRRRITPGWQDAHSASNALGDAADEVALLALSRLSGGGRGLVMERLLKSSRRGPAVPWAPATGRSHAALQKGTQAVSAAADTLKQGAEAQYVAIAGNRRRFAEADGAENRPPCIAG